MTGNDNSIRDKMKHYINFEDRYGVNNYSPLDVIIERGQGVWVYDIYGKKYLDCLSAYSSVNQGHCHAAILEALLKQAQKITITSRAFRNDQLGLFYQDIYNLTGFDKVLPMNTGAEAVESAIKAARKWAYKVKGVPHNKAEIIVCKNNFHGRTTAIVGFSSELKYNKYFGPYPEGFKLIPYGDIEALKNSITDNTCAFLLEPIQGEAGVIIPPEGYLKSAYEICKSNNILFMLDEIQTGLGRTGKLFAYEYEGIRPDVVTIGKALSGGFYPVSAVLSSKEILSVFEPGEHGSTFGGNPLACSVARAALKVIIDEKLPEKSFKLGKLLLDKLKTIKNQNITDIRGKGLFIGIELNHPARLYCEKLKELGILCKDTHSNIIRISPPLVISEDEIEWVFEQFKKVLEKI